MCGRSSLSALRELRRADCTDGERNLGGLGLALTLGAGAPALQISSGIVVPAAAPSGSNIPSMHLPANYGYHDC